MILGNVEKCTCNLNIYLELHVTWNPSQILFWLHVIEMFCGVAKITQRRELLQLWMQAEVKSFRMNHFYVSNTRANCNFNIFLRGVGSLAIITRRNCVHWDSWWGGKKVAVASEQIIRRRLNWVVFSGLTNIIFSYNFKLAKGVHVLQFTRIQHTKVPGKFWFRIFI